MTDTFEPGSTFKVVTMAAALEDRKVLPGTTFALPTEITRYDRTLADAHERPAGDAVRLRDTCCSQATSGRC